MDVILQRHGAKRVYPVPEGLRELCTDISREVLRSQPTNMYQFIADYLDALLHTRETARAIYDIIAKCGVDTETAVRACTIIQSAIRGYQARKTYEAHKVKKETKETEAYLDKILLDMNVTWDEANAAATRIQKLLSSSLLSKNLKVRIYKTVILPVIPYGRETWTLTLREEQRLRVFENKVLRKIFGAKRDEVTGEWRKLHNTELHALYSSPDIIRNIKSRRLRWAGHVAREPQEGKRYLLSLLETKDTVEASAGPFGLTQEEVTQFAEDIVDSIVFEASRSDAEEAVEVAGSIVDTLVINAAVYKPDKTNISEDESEEYSKSRKMEEEKEERMSGRDSITS
ncbi:hypothetical protein ANN_12232 [Periplaneta americana]|uniref:RIIa domain-containing protein n=1 Tax=Periplaneta americana TaxID=6978 RepID=A0ABQ8TI03_PERAM|nr:hypothetical protein ANN_12232 [Periplaneta americana]